MIREEILSKSTPRPWRVGGGFYLPISADVNGKSAQIGRLESFGQIGDEEVEANGELVKLAVNSYDADQELIRTLVEALEGCSAMLEEMADDADPATVYVANLRTMVDRADAALAVAKQREEK